MRRPGALHHLPGDGDEGARHAACAAAARAGRAGPHQGEPRHAARLLIRPTKIIAVMPLFAADASAIDGTVRRAEGSERLITVVFVDLRGSTTIGEVRLPYDALSCSTSSSMK